MPSPAPRRRLLHELRTPLTQIIGYAEMLAEEAEDAGQARLVENLKRIAEAGRSLTTLLERAFDTPRASDREPVAGAREGRILLVDADDLGGELLAGRLQAAGYEVALAGGGEQALALLDAQPFDLVLLEAALPGTSGLEVLRAVRAKRSPAQLPVLLIAAADAGDEVVAALRAGANDHVARPVDAAALMGRIEVLLRLRG